MSTFWHRRRRRDEELDEEISRKISGGPCVVFAACRASPTHVDPLVALRDE